jgi:hypothetical protein
MSGELDEFEMESAIKIDQVSSSRRIINICVMKTRSLPSLVLR